MDFLDTKLVVNNNNSRPRRLTVQFFAIGDDLEKGTLKLSKQISHQ